jgi:hypothetical protein
VRAGIMEELHHVNNDFDDYKREADKRGQCSTLSQCDISHKTYQHVAIYSQRVPIWKHSKLHDQRRPPRVVI